MPFVYHDPIYDFIEFFNPQNGTLVRMPIKNTDDTVFEPWARSYPELIDIGIMGHCTEECKRLCSDVGVDCYQRGASVTNPHMDFDDYATIIDQSKGKTFQVALGGAGDPNKHPNFKEILEITHESLIVPNYTTSGFMLSDKEIEATKRCCGAVAVSYYSKLINGKESNVHTINAIHRYVEAGCKTNIHFVISKKTLSEACERLQNDAFPIGVTAIVFLLYKPVGDGHFNQILQGNEKELKIFFDLIEKEHPFRIGFDTCFVPLLLKNMKNIDIASIDSCEAARFSMYIDSTMNAFPCSFGIDDRTSGLSLLESAIQDVWNSPQFEVYRSQDWMVCKECKNFLYCNGGCALGLPICSTINKRRFSVEH